MKTMLLLSLLATISTSSAFSLVGNRPEFFSGTASTYEAKRTIGIQENQVSFSRLNYRNGNDDNHQHTSDQAILKPQTSNNRKAKSFIQQSNFVDDSDETSRKVDEYLEFLDKRYNRAHNIEATQSKKQFPVLNWLFHHEEKPVAEEENRSNALYALGVAGLASERLLQKHGVVVQKCSIVQPTTDSIEVEHHADTAIESERMPMLLNKIIAAFSANWIYAHRQVTLRKHLLSRAVSRKFQAMAKSALAAIPTSSANVLKAFWETGGGKHSFKFAAATLCFMLMHIAKPLAKGALSNGTHA